MNGFFYVAIGSKYHQEALKSVRSLKAHNPSANVTLFTEKVINEPEFDRIVGIDIASGSFEKIIAFHLVDYKKAVFLDTDTYIVDDISDLFQILDNFDFAASLEVARGYWYREHEPNLPDAFPELNSGVIAFKNSSKTKNFFKEWEFYFEESKAWQLKVKSWELKRDVLSTRIWDQPSLRKALYFSKDIRHTSLPTEYNALRMNGTYLWGKAKIIHGRGNIEEVVRRMNKNVDIERSFFQGFGVIADFSRISFKDVIKTVLRINACAILCFKDKILNAIFRHK